MFFTGQYTADQYATGQFTTAQYVTGVYTLLPNIVTGHGMPLANMQLTKI